MCLVRVSDGGKSSAGGYGGEMEREEGCIVRYSLHVA